MSVLIGIISLILSGCSMILSCIAFDPTGDKNRRILQIAALFLIAAAIAFK